MDKDEKKKIELALTVACRERVNMYESERDRALEACEEALKKLDDVKLQCDKERAKRRVLKEKAIKLRTKYFELRDRYVEVLKKMDGQEKLMDMQVEVIKGLQKEAADLREQVQSLQEEGWTETENSLNGAVFGCGGAPLIQLNFHAPVTVGTMAVGK